MPYTKTTWVNNSTPAISAANLNKMEAGIADAHAAAGDAAIALVVDEPLTSAAVDARVDARTGNGARPVGRDELVVNVHDYGARGDAVTDDTAKVQAAVDAAATFGLAVFFPAGRYRITATITLPTGADLYGPGVIDITDVPAGSPGLRGAGSWGAATQLAVDAPAGASSVQVASTAGIVPGDRIKVSSSQSFGITGQPRGEVVQVESVSGSTLTLTAPLNDTYALAADGRVEKMTPVDRISLTGGLRIEGPKGSPSKDVVGLRIEAATNVTLDVSTRWCHTGGVYLVDVIGFAVTGGTHDDALRAGFGYGIAILWACQDGTLSGLRGTRLRHLVTIGGGGSRRGIARGISCAASVASQVFDAGFDVHPGGEDITFTGCVVRGSKGDGFVSQGGRVTFTGCIATDITRHGFLVQNLTVRGLDAAFTGCVVARCGQRGITVIPDTSGNPDHRVWTAFSVVGGSITATGSHGLSVENADATYSIANVNVRGPVITNAAGSGVFMRGTVGAAVAPTIKNSGPAAEALYLNAAPDSVMTGAVVDVSTTARGVRVVASPASVLSGSRIKNPAGAGVMTDAASVGTLIAGNVITAATRLSLAAGTVEGTNA